MKELNEQAKQEELRFQQELLEEESVFETGFKQESLEETLEQTQTGVFEEKDISKDVQEVTKEEGVRELKGEQPAGPLYIGFDKKFTAIKDEDSERMVAVKAALSIYYSNSERNISDRKALDNLIDACDAYCKGRFAFFKAFRKAGVRLAEVKALRQEAIQRRDAYLRTEQKSELIYEEQEYKKTKKVKLDKSEDKKGKTFKDDEKQLTRDMKALEDGSFDDGSFIDEEEEYENEETLKAVKEKLFAEYCKKNLDPDVIEDLEQEVRERTERAYRFKDYLAENYQDSKFMDGQWELDMKIAAQRIPYQYMISQKKIKEQAGTPEFKEELRQQAMSNLEENQHFPEAKITQRDAPYDEAELKETLEEFEKFNLGQISFFNHVDMLKNYGQNRAIFRHIKDVHRQLMRGINHGFEIEDERLIKLRAKFRASFEMEMYMQRINALALDGKLDLTKKDDEISEEVQHYLRNLSKNIDFMKLSLGNPDDIVAMCEKDLKEEYDKREEVIRMLVHCTEYGSEENPEIPKSEIEKRMKEYEKNSLVYDYMHRRESLALSINTSNRIKVYNEKNGTDIPTAGSMMQRAHGTFMFGKTNEEIVRLTKLNRGGPEERIQYLLEMTKEIKSFDLKEFDTRNKAKFFDDFDRKEYLLQLFTNSKDISTELIANLEKLRQDPSDELELPKEFKELGYKDLAEFQKDMHVYNEVGNALQGKTTSVVQAHDWGFLGAFSLDELLNYDEKKYEKLCENIDAYKEAYEEKHNKSLEGGPERSIGHFIGHLQSRVIMMNQPLTTRPITKEEKKAGKLQQMMTMNFDVMTLYKEEQALYDKKLKEGKI